MGTEENKALIRRIYDYVWNQGRSDIMADLYGPVFVVHDAAGTNSYTLEENAGRAARSLQGTQGGRGDYVIEDMIAEGDKVAVRISSSRGKNVVIYRIEGGKLVETWRSAGVPPEVDWQSELRPPVASPSSISIQQNKAIIRRWWNEVWNEGHPELAVELCGPLYVRHEAAGTRTVTAEEYAQNIARRIQEAYGGKADFVIEDMITEGDKVAMRWSSSLGKSVAIYRIEGGKLVETWQPIRVPPNVDW